MSRRHWMLGFTMKRLKSLAIRWFTWGSRVLLLPARPSRGMSPDRRL
jgi:hypothetical protein